MLAVVSRSTLEAEDWLRYHPWVRSALSRIRMLRTPAAKDPQTVARAIHALCAAARLAPDEASLLQIEALIRKNVRDLDERSLDWSEFIPTMADRHLSKAVLLKPYCGRRERGVIFISFADQWVRLLRLKNLEEFAERYVIVIATSWSPPHSLVNVVFPDAFPAPVFSLLSNQRDAAMLKRLSKNYVPVPLFASSWVDPQRFQPLPWAERDNDIVMVANFGKFKRHHVLFRALRQMNPATRVLLIGQNQDGRTAETIRAEARSYGVEQMLTIRTNSSYRDVAEALARSKVSLILSRREGSCVVVAESLFAGTPVGMLVDAEIGSRAFIHNHTGRFLREENLASQLTEFIAESADYTPRNWAEASISCHRSTKILNDTLREHAQAGGQSWTQDVATMTWCPDPHLQGPQPAWAASEIAEIHERYGLTLGGNDRSQ